MTCTWKLFAITVLALGGACRSGADAESKDPSSGESGSAEDTELTGESPRETCTQALGAIWDARAEIRERITTLAGGRFATSRDAYLAEGDRFVDVCIGLSRQERTCLARGDLDACDLSESTVAALRRHQPFVVNGIHVDLAAAPASKEPSFYDRRLSADQARERMAWLAGTWKRPHTSDDADRFDLWTFQRDGRVVMKNRGFNPRTRRGRIHRHYRDAIGIEYDDGSSEDYVLFRASDDVFYAMVNGTGVRRQPVHDRSAFLLDHEHTTSDFAVAAHSVGRQVTQAPTEVREPYYIDYRADDRCDVLDLRGLVYDATCGFDKGEEGERFVAEFTPVSTGEPYRAEFVVLGEIFLDHRFTDGHRYMRQ